VVEWQWPDLQILLKFKVNRMKIEDFINFTSVVDLWRGQGHSEVKHPKNDNSRTEEATNVKLHHVIQEGDG